MPPEHPDASDVGSLGGDPPPQGHHSPAKSETSASPPPPVASWRLWILALVAGVVAGLVSWRVGEMVVDSFKPELRGVTLAGGAVVQQPTRESALASELKNATLAFAILGGVLGLSLGVSGGLARGALRPALAAAGLGLILGAGVALGVALGVIPIYQRRYDPMSQSLTIPLLAHGGIWGAIGAAGGLALGIGLGGGGRIARGLVGGLIGGFVGAAIYELAGAALFPLDKTFQPLSISPNSRLLARLAVALCTASFAVIAAQASARKSVPAAPAVRPSA